MVMGFTPQLTRWRGVVDGREQYCVELEGMVFTVTSDCVKAAAIDGREREVFETEGTLFTLSEVERTVEVGSKEYRCVEFDGALLTVTADKEVAEVRRDGDGTAVQVHVLESESYEEILTERQHWLDVEDDKGLMVLFVTVNEKDGRIVCIGRCT